MESTFPIYPKSNDQEYTIEYLSQGLNVINIDKIKKDIADNGWNNTACILGYDVSHYDNLRLAGRMLMAEHLETTPKTVVEYAKSLRYKDVLKRKVRFNPVIYDFIIDNVDELQLMVDSQHGMEFNCDWFSANSLLRTYLAKPSADAKTTETPRHLWLRVSVALYHRRGLDDVRTAFNHLCQQYYIPASPTIFNAGFDNGQLASCFLITIFDDLNSILYTGVGDSGIISKNTGGIGLDMSRIRHSEIDITGVSDGLIPWLHLYNATIRACNQGGGKRKGACTVYCRAFHIDIKKFCEVSLNSGNQYDRAHDLNTSIWFPWLFWDRVVKGENWTLFCPAKTKLLNDCFGMEFEREYIKYEADPTIPKEVMKAVDLLKLIVSVQIKSGMPYIMHGDACNMKSNQKHLGYISCGNLCQEIIQYSNRDEISSCNLTSISLRAFVTGVLSGDLTVDYDFETLGEMTRQAVRNLNAVIDENWYPLEKIARSNTRHRPIGLGVSGFGDTLHMIDLSFHDPQNPSQPHPKTKQFNKMIFACMYWNALLASIELSSVDGPYSSFEGSPLSNGKFQFDLWRDEYDLLNTQGRINHNIRKREDDDEILPSVWGQSSYRIRDIIVEPTWDSMRAAIVSYGIRNSLLLTCMPTATSAQPSRNTETTEAHQSNIYSRKLMNGAYPVLNRHLTTELCELGLWNRQTVDLMQSDQGSIGKLHLFVKENVEYYPSFQDNQTSWDKLTWLQQKYKTMWELSTKVFLILAADRGRYIDQSQSTNIYMLDPSPEKLVANHILGHYLGLKTGMYYCRQGAAVPPIRFTVNPEIQKYINDISVEIEDTEEDKQKPPQKLIRSSGKDIICTDEVCVSCQ